MFLMQIDERSWINPEQITSAIWSTYSSPEGSTNGDAKQLMIYHPDAGQEGCFAVRGRFLDAVTRTLNIFPPA